MDNTNLLIKNIGFSSIFEMFNVKDEFSIIAGPCAVESLEQMEEIAKALVSKELHFIRAGAFKPRTSPYSFQGMGLSGLKILDYIRNKYKLITISEILDPRDIELGMKYIDIIQIGARNMMNFSLLKEIGKTKHPVMLKRGMMSTISEFMYAAEYIVSNGNKNLIMCERGIRTFENSTRNTLDISCIAILKKETQLPVIADLSHSIGRCDIVKPILKAVKACGADGVMMEVCPDKRLAKSDEEQQLNIDEFFDIINI